MNDQYLTPETMSNEEATYDKIKDQTIGDCAFLDTIQLAS